MLYISQVLEVVRNAENYIFSLVSSNLLSIFSSNVGHPEKIISKTETTIIQLNIFSESHPVATFWFSSKIGRPKSLLNARGSLANNIKGQWISNLRFFPVVLQHVNTGTLSDVNSKRFSCLWTYNWNFIETDVDIQCTFDFNFRFNRQNPTDYLH